MRRRCLPSLVVFLALSLLVCDVAAADTGKNIRKDVGDFAAVAVRRARRATAIGPFVGASAGITPDSGDFDTGVSFGLALYLFKVPIVPDVKKLVEARVKVRLKEIAKDALARGETPSRDALKAMGRQIYEEVKAEILSENAVMPRKLEKPKLALVLESARMFTSDSWQARTSIGVGVGPVTVGATTAVQFGGGNRTLIFLGPELGLKMLPGKGPRSPVIDFFARYDVAFRDAPANANQFVIGARVLLDTI